LLRLSAIGDTCHVVPLLRTLQAAWPKTRFSWVIGKMEAKLMSLIPEVELITVDKGAGLRARPAGDMKRRGAFDLLLHLQLSIRASLTSSLIPAPIKLGFDKARAREMQWFFTNRQIAPRQREHVLDSFLGFADALGVPHKRVRWDIPLPADARAYAETLIADSQPTMVIRARSNTARATGWPSVTPWPTMR
jgi:heptosyltransferase I